MLSLSELYKICKPCVTVNNWPAGATAAMSCKVSSAIFNHARVIILRLMDRYESPPITSVTALWQHCRQSQRPSPPGSRMPHRAVVMPVGSTAVSGQDNVGAAIFKGKIQADSAW